jgi:hypothetical protein
MKAAMSASRNWSLASAFLFLAVTGLGAATPDNSFLTVVRRYADTMIERGRDEYGPQKSGLLLSALDRQTLAPLTARPAPPGGIRREDRCGRPWSALTGANPQLDQNLLRVFYVLSELTQDPRYRQVADEELKWFFDHTQSPTTGLLAWGEHLSWDVMQDEAIAGGNDAVHEFARPWVLWNRCFELAPEASRRFALGLWEHQIANQQTGAFDRHAPYFKHGPVDGKDFARHGGFYIGTWGHAYRATKNEMFLRAIEAVLARFERKRAQKDGTLAATIGPLDCAIAAPLVPEPLAARLLAFAAKEDELLLPELRAQVQAKPNVYVPPKWKAVYGASTLANTAMFCLERYEQTRQSAYRDLVIAIADAYLNSLPEEDVDVWPMSFAHAICAEAAAYRFTQKAAYLDQTRAFARLAVEIFWQDNPLPRASFKTGHYEAITGADSLALALLEVHAMINHLTINVPQNTIDR